LTDAVSWQELRLETDATRVEPLEDWLFEQGAVAVTLEDNADQPLLEPGPGETPMWRDVQVVALFPISAPLDDIASRVPRSLIESAPANVREVPDQVWEHAWMADYHPMQMGDRLWICPSWTPPPDPSAVNVLLDPGLAFGTGTHPTTAMCLGALDRWVEPGMRIVDFGCGTGILAIAALKLGAGFALGVDNDPQAITASLVNAERNQVSASQWTVVMPDDPKIDQWAGSADIVVANILAGPLKVLSQRLIRLMKPGAKILLAGLLNEQADELITAYLPEVALTRSNTVEGWTLLCGVRSPA